MIKKYFVNLLISIDQLGNTIAGGYPDETISSRMGKQVKRDKKDCKFCYYVCRMLNLLDKNHCIDSIEYDEGE